MQFNLFKEAPPVYGGDLFPGKRKQRRPLSTKRPIHLELKATFGYLYWNRRWIDPLFREYAERFGIRIYSIAINLDHIHIVIKIRSRDAYAAFVRTITGQLARKWGKGFWKCIPFTRVAHWGKDFRNLLAYLKQNIDEMEERRAYKPRKDYYKRYRPKPVGS